MPSLKRLKMASKIETTFVMSCFVFIVDWLKFKDRRRKNASANEKDFFFQELIFPD